MFVSRKNKYIVIYRPLVNITHATTVLVQLIFTVNYMYNIAMTTVRTGATIIAPVSTNQIEKTLNQKQYHIDISQ